jgi:predicted GIY-YIG superfamily endonuclease
VDTIGSLIDQTGVEPLFAVLNGVLDRQLMASAMTPLSAPLATREAGIYAIYQSGELVYIGSTTRLRERLAKHRQTICEASQLDIGDSTFKFVVCSRMAALSAEQHMITYYKPAWNSTGFGNRRHGKGRRHQRRSAWDVRYGREVTAASACPT